MLTPCPMLSAPLYASIIAVVPYRISQEAELQSAVCDLLAGLCMTAHPDITLHLLQRLDAQYTLLCFISPLLLTYTEQAR